MPLTERSHYLPCSWTVAWSYELDAKIRVRERRVHVLDLRSGRLSDRKLENVFVENRSSLAELPLTDLERVLPLNLVTSHDLQRIRAEANFPITLDIEPVLTANEHDIAYEAARQFSRNGGMIDLETKCRLVVFLYHASLRHPLVTYQLQEHARATGISSAFAFATLHRDQWHQPHVQRELTKMAQAEWTVYECDDAVFPLGDRVVLKGRNGSTWCILSPRHLVKMNLASALSQSARVNICPIDIDRDWKLLLTFRQLCLAHATREIAFPDKNLLNLWKQASEFGQRVDELKGFHHVYRPRKISGTALT